MPLQQRIFNGMLARDLFLRRHLKIEEARQRLRLLSQEQLAFQSHPSTPRERAQFADIVLQLRRAIHEAEHEAIMHLRAIDTLYARFERNISEADYELSWNEYLSARHVPFLTRDMSDFIEAGRCPFDEEASVEFEDYPLHSRICVACYENYDPFAPGSGFDQDLCGDCAPLHPSPSLSEQISFLHRYVNNWSGSTSPAPSISEFDWDSSSSEEEDDDDEQIALALRRLATAKLRAATARRTVAALKTKPVAEQVAFVQKAANRLVEETRDLRTEWKRYERKGARKVEGKVMAQSDLAMDRLMAEEEMLAKPLTPLPTPRAGEKLPGGMKGASWAGEVSSRYGVGFEGGMGKMPASQDQQLAKAAAEVEAKALINDNPKFKARVQDEALELSNNAEDKDRI